MVLEPSTFPKKGRSRAGWPAVVRPPGQGKVPGGRVPLRRRPRDMRRWTELYLPQDRAADARRREEKMSPRRGVPGEWRIGLDLLDRSGGLPHAWVAGDDEFGRSCAFGRPGASARPVIFWKSPATRRSATWASTPAPGRRSPPWRRAGMKRPVGQLLLCWAVAGRWGMGTQGLVGGTLASETWAEANKGLRNGLGWGGGAVGWSSRTVGG